MKFSRYREKRNPNATILNVSLSYRDLNLAFGLSHREKPSGKQPPSHKPFPSSFFSPWKKRSESPDSSTHGETRDKAPTKAPGKTPLLPLSPPAYRNSVFLLKKKRTSGDTEGLNPCGKRYYAVSLPRRCRRESFSPAEIPGKAEESRGEGGAAGARRQLAGTEEGLLYLSPKRFSGQSISWSPETTSPPK